MKITKTKSGKWTTLIHINGSDGIRHAKRFTGKTKDEVRNSANDYMNQHKTYIESMAFGDSLQRYIDSAESSLSPSTLAGYKSIQKMLTHEYSAFCGLSCDRIQGKDIQSVINSLKGKGRSAKTIRNYVGLISAVLTAEGFRMPMYNAPQASVPRFNIPDSEIIEKMYTACAGRFERMKVPLALACFGLRRVEICGVTADSLEGDILYIRSVHVQDYDGYEQIKEFPKNEQSIRSIKIPGELAAEIRRNGCAWSGSVKSLSDAWPHLCRAAGVEPFRLHDCRHFFVSYCHDVLHLSDAQIMKMGGWKTDSVMKRRYRHSISDGSDAVVHGIGSLFGSHDTTEPCK